MFFIQEYHISIKISLPNIYFISYWPVSLQSAKLTKPLLDRSLRVIAKKDLEYSILFKSSIITFDSSDALNTDKIKTYFTNISSHAKYPKQGTPRLFSYIRRKY